MNRVDVESAVIAMGDVAVCIKMVDDATEEGNAVQQGRAVQVLMDISRPDMPLLCPVFRATRAPRRAVFKAITHK